MTNSTTSSGVLTINLKTLADNYQLLQTRTGDGCSVAGIVKANAYGLGIKDVAAQLKKLGCTQFFVATLNEAIELRKIDNKSSIAVLNGVTNNAESEYLNHNITPVLNTPHDIERWQILAQEKNQELPAIIHFDTGINRLGISTEETHTLINNIDTINGLNVQMVMSHFACADKKNHKLTKKQAESFAEIAKHFPNAKKSLANSSGLFRNNAYHYDLVRPGYALYGGNPTPETSNPMQNVVSLRAPILQVKNCKKGDSTGYGATHFFSKNTRTATIAIGYADGFLRSNSSKATLYYKGHACPVIGRVSMDLITINVSNIKGKPPEQGDAIEIIGKNQTIDDLANTAKTIGYEILTSLGKRYKREYI